MGSCPITFLWLWPPTDYEPHCQHVSINKIWRWTESTPRSGWWCSHMAGIYSTREINNNLGQPLVLDKAAIYSHNSHRLASHWFMTFTTSVSRRFPHINKCFRHRCIRAWCSSTFITRTEWIYGYGFCLTKPTVHLAHPLFRCFCC